jgi:aryl-alcohol dehydrogenase-like predicted oxidoreductase
MESLNTLVQQRRVLYLGISDTPAWVVAKANCYARAHGLRQFCIYQGRFSAHVRDLERDIIPMCQSENMAIHAWGVMGNVELSSECKLLPVDQKLSLCRILEVTRISHRRV